MAFFSSIPPISSSGAFSATSFVAAPFWESVSNFFKDMFYHPNQHFIAVLIFCAVVVILVVGVVFLIKKIYEKYFAQP